MSETFFITGGLGFIGSAYIRMIANKYSDAMIINVDNMTYAAHPESIPEQLINSGRYHHIYADICDIDVIEKRLMQFAPSYIVHFAAESHVDRSITNPQQFIRTNVEGTLSLLQGARQIQSSLKRFVMISTDEVYGSLSIEDRDSLENDLLCPRSPYSASKAGAEQLAIAFYHTYQLPVVVTRCSNNIGPWQHPEKVVPVFIASALQDRNLPVYGNGKAIRDYIYVDDHCAGIELVRTDGTTGQVYNIGGGNAVDGQMLASAILKYFPESKSVVEFVTDRPGHDMRYSVDTSKIVSLGWQRQYDFDTAVRLTVEWYRSHQSWWKHYYD
jgi:dTDP-glucose 4,6-dehydratase